MEDSIIIKSRNVNLKEGVIEWYKDGIKALNVNTYCFESASNIEKNELGQGCHVVIADEDIPSIREQIDLVNKICHRSNFRDRVLYILYRVEANYPFGVVVRNW